MKENIQKILDMQKDGAISNEQAAALIEEILKKDSTVEEQVHKPSPTSNTQFGFFENLMNGTFLGQAFGSLYAKDSFGNSISMSKVEPPMGNEFTFQDNTVFAAHIKGLRLTNSEFVRNKIQSCHFNDAKLNYSGIKDCTFSTSSIKDLSIESSELSSLEVTQCNFKDITVKDESVLRNSMFKRAHINDVIIQGKSQIVNSQFDASHVVDFHIDESVLEQLMLFGVHFSDVTTQRSRLKDIVMRALSMKDVQITDCEMSDVLFSGKTSWKKMGCNDVKFENCKLRRVHFENCYLNDTIIKNVDVSDMQLKDLNLDERVIDGNEAFLALVGRSI